MKMQKSPPDLVERFKRLAPDGPDIEQRQMFGYPACFVNGNLFTGLFEDTLAVRLSAADREELMKERGAGPFEPMPGRPMREYVALSGVLLADDGAVVRWMERAASYVRTMPPKEKKPAKRA